MASFASKNGNEVHSLRRLVGEMIDRSPQMGLPSDGNSGVYDFSSDVESLISGNSARSAPGYITQSTGSINSSVSPYNNGSERRENFRSKLNPFKKKGSERNSKNPHIVSSDFNPNMVGQYEGNGYTNSDYIAEQMAPQQNRGRSKRQLFKRNGSGKTSKTPAHIMPGEYNPNMPVQKSKSKLNPFKKRNGRGSNNEYYNDPFCGINPTGRTAGRSRSVEPYDRSMGHY